MSFYDKSLRIEYAKTKSYATLKREDPDFIPPSVLKAQANPPIALLNSTNVNNVGENGKRTREDDREEGRARKRPNGTQEEDADEEMEIDEEEEENPATKSAADKPATQTLMCTNLPQEVTDDVLAVLFQQYQGFQSTHVVTSPTPPSKMATVYFESADLASVARNALDGFLLKKGLEYECRIRLTSEHSHHRKSITVFFVFIVKC